MSSIIFLASTAGDSASSSMASSSSRWRVSSRPACDIRYLSDTIPRQSWAPLLIVLLLACCQGVLHQRADGHGTNAARYGRDVRLLRCYLVKLHVAAEAEAALAGRIERSARRADINDDCAFFHHVGRDKLGTANGSDDDVGLTALLFSAWLSGSGKP